MNTSQEQTHHKENETYTFHKAIELEQEQVKIFSVNLNETTISLGLSPLPQNKHH